MVTVETAYRGGGVRLPASEPERSAPRPREVGVASYLDGARLFNAATASNRSLAQLAAPSTSFGRPLQGPRLPGRQPPRRGARRHPRGRAGAGMFGGRAAGSPGSSGGRALRPPTTNLARPAEDHANARITPSLAGIRGVRLDMRPCRATSSSSARGSALTRDGGGARQGTASSSAALPRARCAPATQLDVTGEHAGKPPRCWPRPSRCGERTRRIAVSPCGRPAEQLRVLYIGIFRLRIVLGLARL